MTYKDIFDFNPLTAIFLSGYATHLYILMCFNQQNLTNIQVPTELLSCSKKRIKRWNLLFINFCMSQYQSYLLAHEKEVLQATSKSKGVDLTNPFYVHAQLLIKASQKMIAASSKSAPYNTDGPDERILSLILRWLSTVKQVALSTLGTHFDKNSVDILLAIVDQRQNTKDTIVPGSSSHPHFSPGALFIRTSFIVYLHKSTMDKNLFSQWEMLNAIQLCKVMTVHQFLKESHPKIDNGKLAYSTGLQFPYIHQLPRIALFESWNDFHQISRPIPLGELFKTILNCILGNAFTYHQHDASYTLKSEEVMVTFQNIVQNIFQMVEKETAQVKTNEKQRHFQANKQGKKRRLDQSLLINNEVCMKFLFGTYNQLLNDSQNCGVSTKHIFAW